MSTGYSRDSGWFGSGSYGLYGPYVDVWDLNYSTSGAGSDGGFWGNVGEEITDFIGSGESGRVIEEGGDAAIAGAVAKGFSELYDVLGIDGQQQGAGSGGGSGDGSGSGSDGSGYKIPSWAAPVGVLIVALLGIEIVTS